MIPLYSICQSVTIGQSKIQAITRDLQICDLVTIERDILKTYNSTLITNLNKSIESTNKAELERDKYKTKSKKRGRIIAGIIVFEIIKTGILLL